jgi:hypothetical protein
MSKYPSVVQELEAFLKTCRFDLTGGGDGRVVSLEKETEIVDRILQNFEGESSPPRCWYDLLLRYQGYNIYFNVKISTGSTDNANQKKGIVHSLTHLDADHIKSNMCFNAMLKCIEENSLEERDYYKEYYIIYIDKKDGTVIVRSICDITHFQSNPCNYLQINWKKEKQITSIEQDRTIEDVKHIILGTIAESIKKLVENSVLWLERFYNLKLIPQETEE